MNNRDQDRKIGNIGFLLIVGSAIVVAAVVTEVRPTKLIYLLVAVLVGGLAYWFMKRYGRQSRSSVKNVSRSSLPTVLDGVVLRKSNEPAIRLHGQEYGYASKGLAKKANGDYEIKPNLSEVQLLQLHSLVKHEIQRVQREVNLLERESDRAHREKLSHKPGSFSRSVRSFSVREIETNLGQKQRQLTALERVERQLETQLQDFQAALKPGEELSALSRTISFCSNCGHKISKSEYFCAGCGKELLQNV